MRVAVLILADKTPRALAALASYFAGANCGVFVHVDLKADLSKYLEHVGPLPANTKLIEPRREVFWAGFSMVEATLDLLRAAVEAGPFDRYLFISDNSLPVRPLDKLLAYLAANGDLMTCKPAPSGHPLLARYEAFHLTDGRNFDWRRPYGSPKPLQPDDVEQLERLLALRARGKKPFEMHHGHASWALTAETARHVLDVADNDSWLMVSCRFASHTDEFFFQSIVGAARFPEGSGNGPTYADTFRFFPRVIRKPHDLPFDMHPHFLFLRKIAPDFDPSLPESCLRLYGELDRLLAHDPGLTESRVVMLADGPARHLHLHAPSHDDPAWGPQGAVFGRPFRWSKTETCCWRLKEPLNWPLVRLTLPCVSGGTDGLLSEAYFEIGGRREKLRVADMGYSAEFSDLTAPVDEIALHVRAGGGHGFSVAVLPSV